MPSVRKPGPAQAFKQRLEVLRIPEPVSIEISYSLNSLIGSEGEQLRHRLTPFFQPSQMSKAGRSETPGRKEVRGLIQGPGSPVKSDVVSAGNEMRQSDRAETQTGGDVHRTQAPGALKVIKRYLRFAPSGVQNPADQEAVGGIRVECDCLADDRNRGVQIAAVPTNCPRSGRQDFGIIPASLDRYPGNSNGVAEQYIRLSGPSLNDQKRQAARCLRIGQREIRVDLDRTLQQVNGFFDALAAEGIEVSKRPQPKVVSSQVFRRLAPRPFDLCQAQLRLYSAHNTGGYLVLEVEDVIKRTVEPVRPDMSASRCIDQLTNHANPIGRTTHAAL